MHWLLRRPPRPPRHFPFAICFNYLTSQMHCTPPFHFFTSEIIYITWLQFNSNFEALFAHGNETGSPASKLRMYVCKPESWNTFVSRTYQNGKMLKSLKQHYVRTRMWTLRSSVAWCHMPLCLTTTLGLPSKFCIACKLFLKSAKCISTTFQNCKKRTLEWCWGFSRGVEGISLGSRNSVDSL